MTMDLTRHQSVFNPLAVTAGVVVVGCGALGSALALQLAKLGLENITLFDDDIIEGKNCPNQILFGPRTIGWKKATAAAAVIEILTGYKPTAVDHKLVERGQLPTRETILFVAVDSMIVRKHIFESMVQSNPGIVFFVEGRMNSRQGTVNAFVPTGDLEANRAYRQHMLYPDSEVPVERGTCGNTISIGATANSLACQMTWALINHVNGFHPWQTLDLNIATGATESSGLLR